MIDIDEAMAGKHIAFYSQYVQNPRNAGHNKMNACCPFHEEQHPSFWFNTLNGCWKCESCGKGGNETTFLAKLKGISTSDAFKELAAYAGVSTSKPKSKSKAKSPDYTVAQYAEEKQFTLSYAKDELGITQGRRDYIRIPYRNRDGAQTAFRRRFHPAGDVRFRWAKGAKPSLYGLWRYPQKLDYLILVEGESDSQSLWLLGKNAMGVPGASNFQAIWCEELSEIPRLYLHIEPDNGGQVFREQMTKKLSEGGYKGDVYTFSLSDYDVKDPSELYIRHGLRAADMITAAMDKAEKVDIAAALTEDENRKLIVIPGIPLELTNPKGWKVTEKGILRFNANADSYEVVCRTPIIVTNRVISLDAGEEKVKIAFYRHGKWEEDIYPATTIYQAKNIPALAGRGMAITSENSKKLVSYLDALETENVDRIHEIRSVSQLGWVDSKHFLPYAENGIILDADPDMMRTYDAYKAHGDFARWKTVIGKYREHHIFRFIVAAAFAAPLLKILGKRSFWVYNWGNSEDGKSAALHAALSVWGDPRELETNFNTTRVGLETKASLCCDLPFGLNERQAGGKQEDIEKLVYMLSEGKGKTRGARNGGLQKTRTWRTIVLSNGEEEIIGDSTMSGAGTRVISIFGSPFAADKGKAGDMYSLTEQNYGCAGRLFIRQIIENEDGISNLYEDIVNSLKSDERCLGRSHTHLEATAIVATADTLASLSIWGMPPDVARRKALDMGIAILSAQPTNEERDVNMKALLFVLDWLVANRSRFDDDIRSGERYGFIGEGKDDGKYLIIPSILAAALKEAGYAKNKTLIYFADKGIIEKDKDGKHLSIVKRIDGARSRYTVFDYDTAVSIASGQGGFVELDAADDDCKTPFDDEANQPLPF